MAIDLNADLGEGFGIWRLDDDAALLNIVTSANVACGFHAGDPVIMRRVCAGASQRGVAIGAQVGYHDLAGFGRRRIDIAAPELMADVLYQLGALDAFARVAGTSVRYVKPHGALYNTAVDDPVPATAVAQAVAAFDGSLPLLGLPDSALQDAAASAGLPFIAEAFVDRAYENNGRLVARSELDAVLTDPAEIAARAVSIARDGYLITRDGTRLALSADSVCVHGDTPGAVRIARTVRAALVDAGLSVRSFVES